METKHNFRTEIEKENEIVGNRHET